MNANLAERFAELPHLLSGHVLLSMSAILVGLAISLPLGIHAAGRPRLAGVVLNAASVVQTIPGLALLALMVPLLGGTIGYAPAFLALAVFLTVTVVGFVKNGMKFLGLFWVSSAPLALRPILAIIEIISYFVRPVSHSIRLAGNVMAGHAVIKVFAGFAAIAVISPVSVVAITAMYGLEVLVAFIQAYVFTILTCVYLKDALHPGH